MKFRKPKLLAATLALFAGGLLAAPPAHANPDWELFDATNVRKVAIGDTITAWGTLAFTADFGGSSNLVECRTVLSRTLGGGDQLSAAPGSPLTVLLTPDTTVSTSTPGPKRGVCQDVTAAPYPSGVDLDVTSTGAAVAVDFTMPAASPGIWLSSLATALKLPNNLLTFADPVLGCSWYGPTSLSGASFSGTYAAGGMTAGPGALGVGGSCLPSNGKLESASLSFSPTLTVLY